MVADGLESPWTRLRLNQCKEVEEVELDKGDLFDSVAVMNHAGRAAGIWEFFLLFFLGHVHRLPTSRLLRLFCNRN